MWIAALDPDVTGETGSSLPFGVIVSIALLLGVFLGGMAWIRSQRRSGRTTKFPRIG